MANITLKGNPVRTAGQLPQAGEQLPDFLLTDTDLQDRTLADYKGKTLILNIFPSVDTGVCAASVRKFNEEAGGLANTTVLCISADLPFAHKRFCGAEGIENVESLSTFKRHQFGKDYRVQMTDGPMEGLLSRGVIVADASGKVIYSQQVPEIAQEPDYGAALAAAKAGATG
jgi:thiol peroxidase